MRLEVASALTAGVRVIPVLLQDARMPLPAELPPDLRPLCERQAVEISDGRWDYDVGRLVASLGQFVGRSPGRPGPMDWVRIGLVIALIVVALIFVVTSTQTALQTVWGLIPTATVLQPTSPPISTPASSSVPASKPAVPTVALTVEPSSAPVAGDRMQVHDSSGGGGHLRDRPALSGTLIKTLPEGAIVTRIGRDQNVEGRDWRHIRDESGVEGWIAPEQTGPVP